MSAPTARGPAFAPGDDPRYRSTVWHADHDGIEEPGAPAHLTVHVHQTGSMGLAILPMTVLVNGTSVPVSFGANPFTISSGPLHLEAWGTAWGPYGRVEWEQQVGPGEQVELYWGIPSAAWIRRGNIGTTPQPSPGGATSWTVFILLLVILAALVAAMWVLA